MSFEVEDFVFIDYDTYYQLTGESFIEYVMWKEQATMPRLEDFSLRVVTDNRKQKELEKSRKENDFALSSLIILLEISLSRYGNCTFSSGYLNASNKEKIQELFSLYESVGLSRESTIEMVSHSWDRSKEMMKKL